MLELIKKNFNLKEFSGAFGDVGTDIPLLAGMIIAADLNPAAVLTVFGLGQIASALRYGIPMPVQPLKAVAALVIAGGISAQQIHGAGFAIGAIMLLLTATGMLSRLRMIIPKPVIRGLQIGLGLRLASLALISYIPADSIPGFVLALACLPAVWICKNSLRFPPAVPILIIGLIYVMIFKHPSAAWQNSFEFAIPALSTFTLTDMMQGLILLAIPQIPLSLGNSLFATHQLTQDLFPEKKIKMNTIGYSYSFLNIITAFIGGVPVCHGSGGLAGHYAFGGRTGGSVIIYGAVLITAGMFLSNGAGQLLSVFPLPLLGVILLIEAGMLIFLARDVLGSRMELTIAATTGLMAATLPYGFLTGMIAGTALAYLTAIRRRKTRYSQEKTPVEMSDA